MKDDEICGACSTHGIEIKCLKNFRYTGRLAYEVDYKDLGWEDVE
jgi:hypothetical protein